MAIKMIELIRKIRDASYEATKDLPAEEQIKLINQKAQRLRKALSKNKKESA